MIESKLWSHQSGVSQSVIALDEVGKAAWYGDRETLLKELSSGASADERGGVLVSVAAYRGHVGCLKVLLGLLPESEKRQSILDEALYRAADSGETKSIEMLLKEGASPLSFRSRPLCFAVISERFDAISCLLPLSNHSEVRDWLEDRKDMTGDDKLAFFDSMREESVLKSKFVDRNPRIHARVAV